MSQQPPDEDDMNADNYSRDQQELKLFYEDAYEKQNVYSQDAFSSQHSLSQHSMSHLSQAELSRMEESYLSQTSHHEDEEERQRKKQLRRERRESGVKVKKKRKPPTEIQIKKQKDYVRFKNKAVDISQEKDVGGSIEYIARQKLSSRSEQDRLKSVALKRQARQDLEAEAELQHDGEDASQREGERKQSSDEINWNYKDEGYTTMPASDAKKLPYYIYTRPRQWEHSEDESIESDRRRKRRRKTSQFTLLVDRDDESVESAKSERDFFEQNAATSEQDNAARTFPLHFQQYKANMDLFGLVDMRTSGPNRLIASHARYARQLWTQLVAAGSRLGYEHANSVIEKKQTRDAGAIKSDDSISNISNSSLSSASSKSAELFGEALASQTSVIKIEDEAEDEPSLHHKRQNELLRLMNVVHLLPTYTHRHRLILKVSHELGTNRRLWETEMKQWLEVDDDDDDDGPGELEAKRKPKLKLNPNQLMAIKSFLGIDASAPLPPSWMTDPSMSTHLEAVHNKLYFMRTSLLTQFRRLVDVTKGTFPETSGCEGPKLTKGPFSIEISPIKETEREGSPDRPKSPCDDIAGEGDTVEFNLETKEDEGDNLEDGLQTEGQRPKGVPDGADSAGKSDIPNIPLPVFSSTKGEDYYLRMFHETDIDLSDAVVSLASFLAQLASAKAKLQRLDSDKADFRVRNSLRMARRELHRWHDLTLSYLDMVQSMAEPKPLNFYRLGDSFPASAPFAQAVSLTQSYLANNGNDVSFQVETHYKGGSDVGEEGISKDNADMVPEDASYFKCAAEQISTQSSIKNQSLSTFAPIRLTSGIAMLAQCLPCHVAEVVSRPCDPDSMGGRSPFDLMRRVLKILDDEDTLVTKPIPGHEGKLIDKTFLRALANAAETFRACVELDSDATYWSWHVATLLTMVYVSFGSFSPGRMFDDNLDIHVEDERPQLGSFQRMRASASAAVECFLKRAFDSDCPMMHLSVMTMLEWKQAIFLLHRSTPDYGEEVKGLHAHHTYQWALRHGSQASLTAAEGHYHQGRRLNDDQMLNIAARALDRDPSDKNNWMRFVEVLGSIEKSENVVPVRIDHLLGSQRVAKWNKDFFFAVESPQEPTQTSLVHSFLSAHSKLREHRRSKKRGSFRRDFIHRDPRLCMSWLRETNTGQNDIQYTYDFCKLDNLEHLFQPFNITKTNLDGHKLSPPVEAICMKMVVAGHILGADCTFIRSSIWRLADKWHSRQLTSDESEDEFGAAILWLKLYGLDINATFADEMKNC